MASADRYTYRVLWSDEDGEFVGLCAEFPSLSHLDKDQGKALSGIVKLVHAVLRDMKASKETPPEPLALKDYSGKFVVRVPPDVHRRLSIEAAEAGVSMNRLVSEKLSRR